MDVKELQEVDFFLEASEKFIKNLEEIREVYIQSAEKGVLLDEEASVMEEIIDSWQVLYQNIKQLQDLWERRSSFQKDYKIDLLNRMKQESSFIYLKLQENLQEGEQNVSYNQVSIRTKPNGRC
ncbi:MAG: hypothetical protein ACH349_00725 [Candidatus Rhabdochlamydia sp.]|jgi:hypothetical protein|nr:hypothetical protein [Chlamydiota bacterium]